LKFQDPCPTKPLTLTSKVILPPADGKFNYGDMALLVPHEAVRIMTERTSRMLSFYNPEKHPWKVKRLRTWFQDVYIPIIHGHHDAEEKIFFPFFKAFGAPAFDSQIKDNAELMHKLEDLRRSLSSPIGDDVRRSFAQLSDLMLSHLDEEERFWPEQLRKHGADQVSKVETLIIREGMKHGRSSQITLILVCEAMGCNLTGPHPDAGWASPAAKDAFRSKLPLLVRKLLVPGWERKWLHYKSILLSIQDDEEVAPVTAGCCG
jgi:hypothetical protein